jgi:heavy metal translocating P-type ATPase
MSFERVLRWALVSIAIVGLSAGIVAYASGRLGPADLFWTLATVPVVAGLSVSMVRDLLAGRFGVDAIALVSMSAALALGQPLAGAVVALMYSGGNVLEEIAVARAERDLRSLVDGAPREAHRRVGGRIEEVPISAVAVGDQLLVRAGEVVPVDGVVASSAATIDESALTGEPIPVLKGRGAAILSGSLNAGETFELTVSAAARESTYAGIVRLVTAAQTAKAPFVRLADRYALIFLPVTLALAFVAWLISGDLIRSLAVPVAATPCPLILAAPVAFIAGVAQAARRGILVKGGGPLEALARAHTVLFDKTGTLTVGGARLLSVEVAPGETADEVLMLGASLEQASHHVLASAIVQAGAERGLSLKVPEQVRESMGSGLHGVIGGRHVAAGSRDMIFAGERVTEWASRAIRRASWRSALVVFVAVEGRPIGALLLADELRSDTPRAIRMLREAGVARCRRRRPTPSACWCRTRRIWRAPPRRQRHSPRHRARGRDARWCPGQPRWCDAQARRFTPKGDHCAAGRCGYCSKAGGDRGTIHSWFAWPSHMRCHACGTARAETPSEALRDAAWLSIFSSKRKQTKRLLRRMTASATALQRRGRSGFDVRRG